MNNVIAPPLQQIANAGDFILRLPQVKQRTGLGRSSIYIGVKQGTFPAPVELGQRAIGWLASSVDCWIQSRTQVTRQRLTH